MKTKAFGKPFTGLTVWVENRLDQETIFTPEQIKEKFLRWYASKEQSWIEYYWFDGVAREFITSKDGLNGTFNELSYDGVYNFLLECLD